MIAALLMQVAPLQIPRVDWRVAPVTAGRWSYRPIPGGSEAIFQDYRGPQLTIRCTLVLRAVSVVRPAVAAGAPLRLLTTSTERALPIGNTLTATDPLLDAIAFSRGRFAVEAGGAPPLIVPAWPEAARSIEDCRK